MKGTRVCVWLCVLTCSILDCRRSCTLLDNKQKGTEVGITHRYRRAKTPNLVWWQQSHHANSAAGRGGARPRILRATHASCIISSSHVSIPLPPPLTVAPSDSKLFVRPSLTKLVEHTWSQPVWCVTQHNDNSKIMDLTVRVRVRISERFCRPEPNTPGSFCNDA